MVTVRQAKRVRDQHEQVIKKYKGKENNEKARRKQKGTKRSSLSHKGRDIYKMNINFSCNKSYF